MSQASPIVYQASVYQQEVKYTNFKGQSFTDTLYFALDPLGLMEVISTFEPKQNKKSGNPSRRGQAEDISFTDEQQLKFVRGLCTKAAGFPSEDGNSWTPFENFNNDLAGKAFLTKLISSDEDRKNFVQKVIIDPFEAFVGFASADPVQRREGGREVAHHARPTQERLHRRQARRVAREPARASSQGTRGHHGPREPGE